MGTWNYRVMRHETPTPEVFKHLRGETEVTYAIHEVHSKMRPGTLDGPTLSWDEAMKVDVPDIPDEPEDAPEDHEVGGWTDAVTEEYESVESLRWALEHMLKALDKPVLDDNESSVGRPM